MTDPERVDKSEQIEWASDCNDLRLMAKVAEKAVEDGDYDKAHEKLNEMRHRIEWVSEEYPRYIHECGATDCSEADQ